MCIFSLSTDTPCLGDQQGLREAARDRFCSLYDGYGSLCSCPNPAPLVYDPPEVSLVTLRKIKEDTARCVTDSQTHHCS